MMKLPNLLYRLVQVDTMAIMIFMQQFKMKYYISSKEMDSLFCQRKISQFLSNFANGMKSYLKA